MKEERLKISKMLKEKDILEEILSKYRSIIGDKDE